MWYISSEENKQTYSFDTGRLWVPSIDRYRNDGTFDLSTRKWIIGISNG